MNPKTVNTRQELLDNLDHGECLTLLQNHAYVGRVAFVDDGHQRIFPVNYLADDSGIIFGTSRGTVIDKLVDGTKVGFEVDGSHPLDHSGWSVTAEGTVHDVVDATELEMLRRGPLKPWARRVPERWVRITIEELTGRRIPEH